MSSSRFASADIALSLDFTEAGVGTAIALGRGEVDPVLPTGIRMTLQTTQRLAVN